MQSQFNETYRMSAMRATPYPNGLLDYSVRLPETQLRILNLLVRSTLGWQAGSAGERKAWARVTVVQLTKRVGRTSPVATVEALSSLAKQKLVELRFEDGNEADAVGLMAHRRKAVMARLSRFWVEET